MSRDGLQGAVLDCRLLCGVVSIVLSCLARYPHPSMPSTSPGLASARTRPAALLAPIPQCAVLPSPRTAWQFPTRAIGECWILTRPFASSPPWGSLDLGGTLVSSIISPQSFIKPPSGNNKPKLDIPRNACPDSTSTGKPPFPLLSIAISGISCLGRLVTVPAAIRAGNYPAHDGQTTA